ncbi:hypothetical protein SKAU_G00313660 [Synaphobranchus kaupii]|uniref:Uncharacterized protein n=1 Tax=Synaphobranchus kaupii TaxID=118154 RepID=A0A9Q1ILH3_SYNKA|nr:hypothetical protein SKAU_G00313660 [Synaphobranchus kaupii]
MTCPLPLGHVIRWCSATKATDYDSLSELILMEEVKNSLPERLVVYLNEKKVLFLSLAAMLADEFVLTHKTVFSTPRNENRSAESHPNSQPSRSPVVTRNTKEKESRRWRDVIGLADTVLAPLFSSENVQVSPPVPLVCPDTKSAVHQEVLFVRLCCCSRRGGTLLPVGFWVVIRLLQGLLLGGVIRVWPCREQRSGLKVTSDFNVYGEAGNRGQGRTPGGESRAQGRIQLSLHSSRLFHLRQAGPSYSHSQPLRLDSQALRCFRISSIGKVTKAVTFTATPH